MKNILIHVKDNEALNNYISMIENKNEEKIKYSREVKEMINEFYNNKWGVYLTTIENFDNDTWKDIYFINENKKVNMDIKQVNEIIDFMIIRNLGSVEAHFNEISDYLDFLISNYKGIVLNNPIAMKKGMTKNYLTQIDKNKLQELGMYTIPTKIYDKKVSFKELLSEYKDLDEYLIKPVTGELSNSLNCLKDIDEEFLRKKERKVGGWVVQPIKEEIWNGEFQLVFIGEELIYAQKKNYPNDSKSNIPNQKDRKIEKYEPSQEEISIGKKVIKYFKELYNIRIDICRIDFMKNDSNQPILIEFEMVNPGFFIGYMQEDDVEIKNIVKKIRNYCENYNK